MMQTLVTWYHVTEKFPPSDDPFTDDTDGAALLFLHGGILYTGFPVDADPDTDPMTWQWETWEPSTIMAHVSWWAPVPAMLFPRSVHDSWLSCPCQACATLRAADVPVARRPHPSEKDAAVGGEGVHEPSKMVQECPWCKNHLFFIAMKNRS